MNAPKLEQSLRHSIGCYMRLGMSASTAADIVIRNRNGHCAAMVRQMAESIRADAKLVLTFSECRSLPVQEKMIADNDIPGAAERIKRLAPTIASIRELESFCASILSDKLTESCA
jgi:hypothetical protein